MSEEATAPHCTEMTLMGASRVVAAATATLFALLALFGRPQISDLIAGEHDGNGSSWLTALGFAGLFAVLLLPGYARATRYETVGDTLLLCLPAILLVCIIGLSNPWAMWWAIPYLAVLVCCCSIASEHLRFTPPWVIHASTFASGLLFTVCVLAVLASPLHLPIEIGPIPLVFTGVMALGLVGYVTLRLPRLSLVYAALCALAAIVVPVQPLETFHYEEPKEFLGIGSAFVKWLDARDDRDAYRVENRPYPVIVTSAEGGGIYAAAHSYYALRAMSERCPNFAQHFFLAVGVSGGGVGQTLFAESQRERPQPPNLSPCSGTTVSDEVGPIGFDYLSPLLANLIVIQPARFLSLGLLSEAVDGPTTLAMAIQEAAGSSAVALPLHQFWDHSGAMPGTVAVATNVKTGRRFGMAPFQLGDHETMGRYFPTDGEQDVSAAAAAALSALFPWLTSTGKLQTSDGSVTALADGGYAENTGAETATELIDLIRMIATDSQRCWVDNLDATPGEEGLFGIGNPDLCKCPLIVRNDFDVDFPMDDCWRHVFFAFMPISAQVPSSVYMEEPTLAVSESYLLDPLAALLRARDRQSVMALERLRWHLSSADPLEIGGASADGGLFNHTLPVVALGLPLSWKLSAGKARNIMSMSAPISSCPLVTVSDPDYSKEFPRNDIVGPISPEEDEVAMRRRENGCDMKMLAWLFNPANRIEPYSIKGKEN